MCFSYESHPSPKPNRKSALGLIVLIGPESSRTPVTPRKCCQGSTTEQVSYIYKNIFFLNLYKTPKKNFLSGVRNSHGRPCSPPMPISPTIQADSYFVVVLYVYVNNGGSL